MNPQVGHALKVVAIAMAIAALSALAQHLTDIPVDQNGAWVLILVGALIPAVIRVLEGASDAGRAALGEILPRDVGYRQLLAYRKEPEITPKGRFPA